MDPSTNGTDGERGAAWPYGAAALLGLALALWTFPPDFWLPGAGAPWRPVGDAAQHIIAQRYFLHDAWRWPPLVAANLNTPMGTNIAFADGIPLIALPLKLIAPWLPAGFHGIGLWYAIAYAAQPVAAIWCLRGTGETRAVPALAAAAMAAAMPAFLARYGHAALSGHFFLLIALGLYLRLTRAASIRLWAAAVVTSVAALLAHPYLAAMCLALLAAAPLTLLLRGDRRWPWAALGAGAAVAAPIAAMAAFGYLGAQGDGGYGDFALNLLSPVWPFRSLLFRDLAGSEIDATGHGGWEGYNYLGAGLLLGLLILAVLAPRAIPAALRRHAGLALALLGLTALAISHRVGLGTALLLDLGTPPALLEQFRASGRFFWPVGYALLIGCIALLARQNQASTLLALLALLQFADTLPIRAAAQSWASQREPWSFDAPALRRLFATHSRLTLIPSWACVPVHDRGTAHASVLETLALASETAIPANTMYLARWHSRPACRDAETLATPVAAGELRLLLPEAPPAPGCTSLGQLRVCAVAP